MNEGGSTGENQEEYVEVLHDYEYEYKGQKYSMCKGQILMVLKHSNKDWWQVIQEGGCRAFYAPAQHLQRKSLSEAEMWKIVGGCSTISENAAPARRSPELGEGGSCPSKEHASSNTTQASQASKPFLGHHESPSSHASKLSLNEGSAESLKHPRKSGIKAGSTDELRSKGRSYSTLDVSKIRASSNEELDGRTSGRDLPFRSSDLSLRHRSSSFDLRMTPKELSLTEMKQSSLDNSRKVKISKDQGDRRRSWALENFRKEIVNEAIVLDVPPELPPKTKSKHRLSTFNSNSENISHLEGPVDLKVEQVRMARSGQPPVGNELCVGMEAERKHSRHSSDPLLLLDEKTSSLTHQESHNGKDLPVALPRKLLPPQTALLEDRNEGSMLLGDHALRDTNGNKVKKSYSHSSLTSPISEGFGKAREPQGSLRLRGKACEPTLGKPSNTTQIIANSDIIPIQSHKSRPESPKTRTVKSKFPQGFGSFRKNSKREAKEKEEREKELLTRETPTPDSSRGGKIMQSPPSPRCPPLRTLSGDWGEYLDEASRSYYYNSSTQEKRWKPPRKGVPSSNTIPEVPPSSKTDDSNYRGNVPPKCPTPDYPTSPRPSHKPFSYTSIPDTPHHRLTFTRSATLNPSSTCTPHPTIASTSHTLPNNSTHATHSMSSPHHTNKQKIMPLPLSAPPIVPPSSAKPTYPTTPTTPEFKDLTTTAEDHNYALLDILYKMELPHGWVKKYDAFNQRIYFYNRVTRERWLATTNDEGKVYYYEESGTKSAWRLPEVDQADLPDKEELPSCLLSPPPENLRLSNITENLHELSDNTLREGFLHRTFLARDGKKVRKNWTQSYARYIVGTFNSGSSGILYFSKTRDDEKKPEVFEFFPPYYLEHASDKKTSRQQVLGLRNGHDTEVLLQFEEREIAEEWFKVLKNHEGMEYNVNPTPEKEEKKGKKGTEKIKRETSVEQLSPDSKGIKDKLRYFIKRRPMKETLEHKGIYKESVFGSTLAELKIQDKTNIPIFILQCIQHIEKSEENLQTDGLYRISGNAAQIQKIRYEVAQRKYSVLSQEKEIHNLSGALKLFFRELKEPLIPYDNYDDFIRATGSEYRRMNQQADKLMKAVNKLPNENYDTLKVLMQHLLRVSEYESENRMSLSNLAIVFGPCLMWPRETLSHDLMTDVMLHNRVVEGLLSDFTKIFSKK